MEPKEMVSRCTTLRNKWNIRNRKFKDWYNILTLKDELAQKNQESVVANDPRTGYNLGRHLLTSSVIAHKIYDADFQSTEIPAVAYLESYMEKRWRDQERRYRVAGRRGWLDELSSFLLAFGWYAVYAMVNDNGLTAEVWNPYEVFPNFGAEGLIEVAHIYPLSPMAANYKIKNNGWTVNKPFTAPTILYDYFAFDMDGDVTNGIVIGEEYVKLPVKDEILSKVHKLPVFTSPAGGLPDQGALSTDWQKHYGESIVATNEDLSKNYNRMLSFTQQATRNAAQHRWLETSTGDTHIATEEKMNKFGTVLYAQPGEDVRAIIPPPIPVELTQALFRYENMLQRGLFAASMYGNIQQTMSYLAMANVASSSIQTMSPYVKSLSGLLSSVDDFWYAMIKEGGFHPNSFKMPENVPEETNFDVQVDIEIPGYLVQRATVARMLDPTFQLSTETVMKRLFPEIKDPFKEQAKARKDLAMSRPEAILADAILAYRSLAIDLRGEDNEDAAKLYEKIAESMESQLSTPAQNMQAAGQPTVEKTRQAIMNEVLPKEFSSVEGGAENA